MNDSILIIFLHVPKTAGTTMLHILNRVYAMERRCLLYPDQTPIAESLAALNADQKLKLQLLAGHVRFGVDKVFTQEARYFTILRDPVERIISTYHHIRREYRVGFRSALHEKAISSTLHEYIVYLSTTINQCNGMTFQMAGDHTNFDKLRRNDEGRLPDVPAEAFDIAKHNLATRFDVVGLTERFDESLILLKNTFGWRNIYHYDRNTTSQTERVVLLPETIELIKQTNQLDMDLYAFGKQLFEKQVTAQGPSFEQQCLSFKRRNRIVGRVLGAYRLRTFYGKLPGPLRRRVKSLTLRT
jgi:hypothetical protein